MQRVRCLSCALAAHAAIAAVLLAPACLAGAGAEICAEGEEAPCMQVGLLQKVAQVVPEGNASLPAMAAEGDREEVGLEPPAMIGLSAFRLMRHAAVMTAGSTSTTLLIVIPLVIIILCCCCGHCCRRIFHGGGFGFGGEGKGKGKGKGEWEKDRYDYDYRYDPHAVPPPAAAPVADQPPGRQHPEPHHPVREGKGYGKDKDKDKWDRDYSRDNRW